MTNNEIMFQCQVDLLNDNGLHRAQVYKFINDWYQDAGKEINQNFSHDNWSLVYCWCKRFSPSKIKGLPLFGHFSLRPDNFSFYFCIKYPRIGKVFLPLMILSMAISMSRVWRENKYGEMYIDTDGKIISYFKTEALGMKRTKKLLDTMIEDHPSLKTWENIFSIYFKPNHPVMVAFKDNIND